MPLTLGTRVPSDFCIGAFSQRSTYITTHFWSVWCATAFSMRSHGTDSKKARMSRSTTQFFLKHRSRQTATASTGERPGRRSVSLPIEEWSVCLPDHHPGYITWDEYLATRERLRNNVRPRGQGGGAAREGVALLQGIPRCGRCGRRMQIAYSGNDGRVPRYACVRAHHLHGAEHACQSLGGTRLEKAVAAAFLDAITPAGVRACTEAVTELEHQHEQRLHGQRLAVERAEFETGRAQRQFDACEPEHRLVARTLEARLQAALTDQERERRKLAELDARHPEPLTGPPPVWKTRRAFG